MFWDLLTWTLDLYFDVFWYGVIERGRSPLRTDCVTIFLNVVARGGTVRWNRLNTPDLCLATSWLHDLIYNTVVIIGHSVWEKVPLNSQIINTSYGAKISTQYWYGIIERIPYPTCIQVFTSIIANAYTMSSPSLRVTNKTHLGDMSNTYLPYT
jgi:hypothetical protein